MSVSFELHPRLEADTLWIGQLPLSRVLLMQERRYPWIILVPTYPGLVEVSELDAVDQARLIHESSAIGRQMRAHLSADKINVASIGNVVSQLHWHVIARYRDDSAWPSPVWGRFAPEPYQEGESLQLIERLRLFEIPGFKASGKN